MRFDSRNRQQVLCSFESGLHLLKQLIEQGQWLLGPVDGGAQLAAKMPRTRQPLEQAEHVARDVMHLL